MGGGAVERSRDWLAQARGDLALARYAFSGGFYDWTVFAAQQAAEKAVKGALQSRGAEVWGHSVATLLRALAAQVPVPDELVDAALELDKGYIAARYPDVHPSGAPRELYTRTEAERALAYGERIVEFCARLVAGADA
ncbi:MAG: HEPN domain-containing protein [Thermomicrobium sp.]|nr:HEPN domain-containing protein [Thermomicrobium sp.]MDW8059407.1 HEPN domain-containing protein [Thermomicrobium sp.]